MRRRTLHHLRRRRAQRGASLIESMVAIAVLAIGTASISELLRDVTRVNEKAVAQTRALEAYNEFKSQLRAASCNIMVGQVAPIAGTADPGLIEVDTTGAAWITAPVATAFGASVITKVGDFDEMDKPTALSGQIRAYNVAYRVTQVAPAGMMTSFDVEVRVQEYSKDAAIDAANAPGAGGAATNQWVRTYPLRKVCNFRDEVQGAGPTSRGSFQ